MNQLNIKDKEEEEKNDDKKCEPNWNIANNSLIDLGHKFKVIQSGIKV